MKRRLAILVIGPLLALLGCTVAWAFWTTTGSGTASASTGTLNAPTAVTATSTTGTGTVQVSWTVSAPAAGGLVPSGYYVTRVRNSDGVASSACATSPTVVTASSLCTDSAVADGTYHYVVTGVKASWTASSGASGNVTIVNDTTAPIVAVASVNGSARTFPFVTNTNVTTIGGTCGTLAGDIATVNPRINGAATAPISTPCSAGTWTLTLSTVLTAEATSTLSAIQTDAAGNTGTAANQTVTIDKTSPVVSVTSVNGSARSFPYFTNASLTTIGGTCGTLTGDSTTITPLIAGIATIPATATCSAGTWTLTLTPAITTEATRTLTATQTDTAGNSGTAVARTVTIDKTAPVVVSVQLANGSSSASGRADSGDTVSINYGEQMDGATFCSSWNNSGTNTLTGNGNVTVTITENGNSDTLTVTASPCAGLKVGSIALGANYVSSTTSFNGNGSNVSEISLSTAGILTIKLGTGSNSPTGASASTPIYTPVSGLSDLAGNALPVAAKTGTSSSF